MFVRFRKLPCDGFRPNGVAYGAAHIACRSWNGIACRGHCHMKPRCRWRIGRDEQLAPYRVKVVLVENKRVNGKVKQETIAVLGSIEATWLPDFWEDTEQKVAAKLKAEHWELKSLRARMAFWETANNRLKLLANRLGPDLKRIRMTAHARVPLPMESERQRLELLEAKADFDLARSQLEASGPIIDTSKKLVKKAQETLAENEALARFETRWAAAASAKVVRLSTRRP